MSNPDDRIITSSEAARLLRISVSTAQLWIKRGILPSWRTPGGHRRLYMRDVLELAATLRSEDRETMPLPAEFIALDTHAYPTPSSEPERLVALYRSKLVDSMPEQAFDRLTQLAAHVSDCPMALVTLLTSTRQWFKSRSGVALSETPRKAAFCSYTVLARAPFVVEDATNDPRFVDNPLVVGEPHIRFYAGFPVFGLDDMALGALCVLDREPRRLRQREMRSMQHLADLVSDELRRQSRAAVN